MSKPRVAVVLFNLGGPDSLDAVKPFLTNLFSDPLILRIPNLIRPFVAKRIATKRTPVAQEIYEKLGGASPILPFTQQQAELLERTLSDFWNCKVFTAMRYWHPRSKDVVRKVKEFAPERIVLLPLYPQFSTTTTKSSIMEWYQEMQLAGLDVPISPVCCYPIQPSLIEAHAELLRPAYEAAAAHGKPRILFSAHGLPQKVVKDGDPYQWQVEQTTQEVVKLLRIPNLDYVNCFQSKVGPLEWLKPSTEEEIVRAGRNKIPLVIVPISFVSEHSETMVELDMEYLELAREAGVPYYGRVEALGANPSFIQCLAQTCLDVYGHKLIRPNGKGQRLCPPEFKECPCRNS